MASDYCSFIKKEIEKSKLPDGFKKELMLLVEKKRKYITDMLAEFDKKRTMDSLKELRRRFPLEHDSCIKIRKFKDFKNLSVILMLSLYMREKMPEYINKCIEISNEIHAYLSNGSSKTGKKYFQKLVWKKGHREKEIRRDFLILYSELQKELSDYEDETDAYLERNIDEFGLKTFDAVKCLNDFEGRTFPFLRAISQKVEKGDFVLEIGSGTGVFCFSSKIMGAEKVIGFELNPITTLLSIIIKEDFVKKGLFKDDEVLLICGNALKLNSPHYRELWKRKVDVLISENIYTGMFFELQLKMITHVLEEGIVPIKLESGLGKERIVTTAKVIAEALSSNLQLAEVKNFKRRTVAETLQDIEKQGGKVKFLSVDHPYDYISFKTVEPGNVLSRVKLKVTEDGELNGICIYSTLKMCDGEYIDRNENIFLNNDSILFLNKPIKVKKGDLILVSLAYNDADSISDIILEVRKIKVKNNTFIIPEKYDAILNISEEKHLENIVKFKIKNGIPEHMKLNLTDLGDYEVVRSSSFVNGHEEIWLMDIDYYNIDPYGLL